METKGKRGVEHHSILGAYSHQKQAHGGGVGGVGGAAILFCQLPPLPCHRLSAQDRPCCASDTWVWTDKTQSKSNLRMSHHQTSFLWPVLCKPGSYLMPCLTLHLGTGLAINLKCISLFWSTRGLQYCCTIRLRVDCFQKTTTVCYCW